jgi:hypothetical protein
MPPAPTRRKSGRDILRRLIFGSEIPNLRSPRMAFPLARKVTLVYYAYGRLSRGVLGQGDGFRRRAGPWTPARSNADQSGSPQHSRSTVGHVAGIPYQPPPTLAEPVAHHVTPFRPCHPPGIYHRRWEIETSFSELKVIQGMKRDNLRSRTPEGIAFEIAGHVLFYLLVRWMMVEAAVEHGCDPLRLSFTHALRELHDLSEKLITSSLSRVRQVLLPRLLARVASHLVPMRPGRHYPRPNDTKPKNTGKGRIRLPHKLTKQPTKRKNTATVCCSKG